jgi:hypothetical protein
MKAGPPGAGCSQDSYYHGALSHNIVIISAGKMSLLLLLLNPYFGQPSLVAVSYQLFESAIPALAANSDSSSWTSALPTLINGDADDDGDVRRYYKFMC